MFGTILSAGANIAGGFLNRSADRRNTDAFNVASAKEAQKARQFTASMGKTSRFFNRREAKLNREFQAGQTATVHQREVKDLRAAGLNPILSAHRGAPAAYGSAASASGAAGTQAPVQKVQEDYDLSTTAYQSYKQAKATRALTEAQIKTAGQQEKLLTSQKSKVDLETQALAYGNIKNKAISSMYAPGSIHRDPLIRMETYKNSGSPTTGKVVAAANAAKKAAIQITTKAKKHIPLPVKKYVRQNVLSRTPSSKISLVTEMARRYRISKAEEKLRRIYQAKIRKLKK